MMLEVIILFFQKPAIGFLDGVELAKNIQRVFKRHWPVESLHDINHSPFGSPDPIGELHVIRNCGTEHNDTDMFGQHDDSLLPNHSSLLVVNVMNLIENYPFNVADHLCPSVQVVTQNLCCHDHACCLLVH